MRLFIFALTFFILISYTSSAVFISQNNIIPIQGVNVQGVEITLPEFNFSTLNVTGSNYWNTNSLGPLNDANTTQFSETNQTLNVDESWLNSLWLRLDGINSPFASINWGDEQLHNVKNLSVGTSESEHTFTVEGDFNMSDPSNDINTFNEGGAVVIEG